MIKSFLFDNTDTGWSLEETSFDEINLLVGPSGAGKTKILDAFHRVWTVGLDGAEGSDSSHWSLKLEAEGNQYQWIGLVALPSETGSARFIHEYITKNFDEKLVDRSEKKFRFGDSVLPRLQESESAIELLQEEPSIRPLYRALQRWHFIEPPRADAERDYVSVETLVRKQFDNLDDLRRATQLPTLAKAFALQEDYPRQFDAIRQLYLGIFPTVSDLRIARYQDFGRPLLSGETWNRRMVIGVQEKGVRGWVVQDELSAGMLKVLYYLIELTLAPAGSVIFIDEIENSLGVNCLPDLSEHLLERAGEVQFIITSHHPQVINSITTDHWKLVTRRGSVVTVRDAESIPALHTASPLQKFTQLINLPEYAEGVA